MARPVEYDLEKVLDSAMEIFWEKGYEGVSMAQLVSHTGLNRRTMYSLFKDKQGLFKDSLDNYYIKWSLQKLNILKSNPGKKGIELFFQSFKFRDNFKGCLFSNTMREKQFMDEETYSIPKQYFDHICSQMETNLKEATKLGEFSADPKAMALTIITFIHGFHVYGKYNHSQKDSDIIINNILSMIR
ncbi:TetR/AcrR family transcriptional regulator [Poseidonibacter ostreae]|uniref:TetR family transcriptional regulator n=1 Tax=Poseidonibacter ostreae TaxID=2654171 RepID=A0A6L4WUW2_9BACT|nr:TetR/AcrR family transcriptional regulator [Poseidonibacter ostreae]KAB7890453.1 TetR family transcriptional regulator [Poseidonibacter ostreae]